jgi:hypothetical protein
MERTIAMNLNYKRNSPPPPNNTPPPAPWNGMTLVALDRRPFARSLLKSYGPAGMAGYCAVIAFAASQQWPWLAWWLGLWTPIVDVLRQIIPLFDNFEHEKIRL